mmetsp:Transcript_501/g.1343  ORF Transcript_501/g.1343 Transcript_501/m.1343 type:complete len:260 (-) Transcript_501:324-1103(-)
MATRGADVAEPPTPSAKNMEGSSTSSMFAESRAATTAFELRTSLDRMTTIRTTFKGSTAGFGWRNHWDLASATAMASASASPVPILDVTATRSSLRWRFVCEVRAAGDGCAAILRDEPAARRAPARWRRPPKRPWVPLSTDRCFPGNLAVFSTRRTQRQYRAVASSILSSKMIQGVTSATPMRRHAALSPAAVAGRFRKTSKRTARSELARTPPKTKRSGVNRGVMKLMRRPRRSRTHCTPQSRMGSPVSDDTSCIDAS